MFLTSEAPRTNLNKHEFLAYKTIIFIYLGNRKKKSPVYSIKT